MAADLDASDVTPTIYRVLEAIARHPNTQAKTLKALAGSEDHEISELVAMAGNTSLPVLKGLLRRGDKAKAVAQHASHKIRKLFPKLLEALDEQDHALLASNPHLSGMDLEDLEGTTSPAILAALASNAAYYQDRVDALATSDNLAVRMGAASNPKAWPTTLHRLSADPEQLVVQAVAANPGATAQILTQLFTVRPDTHEQLAGNPTTPQELLEALHRNGDLRMHKELARNPSTSTTALAQLAGSTDAGVQWRVVNNPSATREALTALQASGRNWAVRHAAQRRTVNAQGALDAPPPLEAFQEAVTAITKETSDTSH